jgi:hypothetical protein
MGFVLLVLHTELVNISLHLVQTHFTIDAYADLDPNNLMTWKPRENIKHLLLHQISIDQYIMIGNQWLHHYMHHMIKGLMLLVCDINQTDYF